MLLIDEKNNKDLMIYFTKYVHRKPDYHELTGKIEEHERKIYLMLDDYMLGKVLDKISKKKQALKTLMILRN